jgi:hypothetical protein
MTEHNPAARRAALGLSPRPLNHHRRRRSWRARLVWWIGCGALATGAALIASQIPKL